MLALVDIYREVDMNGAGIPVGTQGYDSDGTLCKRYVVDVEHIDCPAGYIHSTIPTRSGAKRFYYVYQGMIPNDIRLGDPTHI